MIATGSSCKSASIDIAASQRFLTVINPANNAYWCPLLCAKEIPFILLSLACKSQTIFHVSSLLPSSQHNK